MTFAYETNKQSDDSIQITFLKEEALRWAELTKDSSIESSSLSEDPLYCYDDDPDPISTVSLGVNYDANSIQSTLSSVSSFEGPIQDIYRRRRGTKRKVNNRTRIRHGALNYFLDFLSTCFWKCSTGCQQLPDQRY